ncbi:MAG: two-component system, LytTR family, response regulator [Thermoanaerobaculia bacterium]|jgi:two-component system LytT family response regulator|nr:two-component system, LytTR family, response regulator [Thermoanaerobaculia bacterium]
MTTESEKTLRVLIADDELLARQRIEDLLAKEHGVEIVGTASTGTEAVEKVRELKPDLLFLDVQMPGLTGLQVAETIGAESMPATIFVTAFDQFALKAFEVAATDYLVKPFDDERFAHALKRARKTIELEEVQKMTKRLLSLLHVPEGSSPARPDTSPKPKYLERITVEMRGQLRVVPVSKVDYVSASGPYAELHVGDRTFAVRERMQTLEEQLDPAVFFRIHRSAIVRLDRIDTLLRASGGDYAVRLKDGTELSLSRNRREELERRLGVG